MQVIVAAVSSNTNAFGLRNHVFVARDGRAFSGCGNHIRSLTKGTVINLKDEDPLHSLAHLGFELADRLPLAPPDVVAEVWK